MTLRSKFLLFASVLVFWASFASVVEAGLPFFPMATVYVARGGVKAVGDISSENSKATSYTYRSNI